LRTQNENTALVVGHMERGSGKTYLIAVHFIHTRTLMATIKEWILPGMTVISGCGGAYRAFEEEGRDTLG
jgi:transposase-like protein